MKRHIVCISLILCMALLLCSCGGVTDVQEPDSSAPEPSEEIDLTLWTFPVGGWGNPTQMSNYLLGFHKAYPNIHVSVEYLTYDDGDRIIEQAAAEGRLPDLVLEGPERLVANWGEKGWMADLGDLWESEQAGEIYANVRNACQHQNGCYYEFPICMAAHCMVINYDLFKAAGALSCIDEETHTWTTEDFIEAVHKLTAYGQKNAGMLYCKNQSGDQGTRALVNNLYNGHFTNPDHTAYTIDSEEIKAALQLLYDLEGITFEPTLSAVDAIDLFCKKESAMCFCWNTTLEIQQTLNNPDLDFEMFPMAFPTNGEAPRLEGGIWGFGIFDNGSSERIEAAKTFIRYTTENDTAYARAVTLSAYWPVRDGVNVYENDALMTKYSVFMAHMGDYYQITPGWADARTAWWQMLAKIGAGTSVEEAVKNFPQLD